MTRRRVNNPLALAALACLSERPMHPYEISTTLRSRGKEQSIKLNYGSLYSVVESLQKHGLITPRETIRRGNRPERTVYEITDAGLAEFEDWLSELLSTPTQEFTSLEAALSLMPGLPPDDVARLLDARCGALEIKLRADASTLDAVREQGVPDIFLVEMRYQQAMREAELAFVRQLASDIRSAALDGVKTWRKMHEAVAAGVTGEEIAADPVRHLGKEGEILARLNSSERK